MSQSATPTAIEPMDIDRLLEEQRQVAVVWTVEDVQAMRRHLTPDQAWAVLLDCKRHHGSKWAFTWNLIYDTAEYLFPELFDTEQCEQKTSRPGTDNASSSTPSMPSHVLDALQLVLEHYYRQELDHYESGGPGKAHHIFHALNLLKHWAASQP